MMVPAPPAGAPQRGKASARLRPERRTPAGNRTPIADLMRILYTVYYFRHHALLHFEPANKGAGRCCTAVTKGLGEDLGRRKRIDTGQERDEYGFRQ